jgi:DNA polymerase III epsilon subunit-like protein
MKRFYFDTETTGFPQKAGTPLPQCPFIVQLAAILVDDEEGEIASLNTIIKPDGWTVGEGAAEVHGISTEKADTFGIPVKVAMAMFSQLARVADQVIAHNIQFDLKLVAYEIERLAVVNVVAGKPQFCTMAATTDICRLPGRYRGQFKWPKLIEAHQHLFNEGFDGAHDALADVRACQRIHKHLIQNNLIS